VSSGNPCGDANDCTDDSCDEGSDLCEYACNATGPEDACCDDPVCAGAPICEAPACEDLDGDGYGSPASPACTYPTLDCLDDPSGDAAVCDTCVCGDAGCAGCARCIHPGAKEFSGDGYDSNCNGNNDCFIATASFGTEMAGKIDRLRQFRDQVLLASQAGTDLVNAYYRTSPPIADFIRERPVLRSLVRILLLPVVGFANLLL